LVKEDAPAKVMEAPMIEAVDTKSRAKGMNKFWDKFKNNLLELFKEEGDKEM
jgi:cell division protein FtsA